MVLIRVLKMNGAFAQLIGNGVRGKMLAIDVDGGGVEPVLPTNGDVGALAFDAKLAGWEQQGEADVQQERDQEREPIIDDALGLQATENGYVFLKQQKYDEQGEEDHGDLALAQKSDGIDEQEESDNQGEDGHVSCGTEQGGNDADRIEDDEDCGKQESESPKKSCFFHRGNLRLAFDFVQLMPEKLGIGA